MDSLSNTTLGIILDFVNGSSVLLALPVIFRGIGIDPLAPSSFTHMLWRLYGINVVCLCETLTQASLASFKFNFRGVGGSQGAFSQGIGEQEDVGSSHFLYNHGKESQFRENRACWLFGWRWLCSSRWL